MTSIPISCSLAIASLLVGFTTSAAAITPRNFPPCAKYKDVYKRQILLPSAMPGIITGIILAIGRIVGESAALLFTAGSGYLLPKTFAGFFKKIFESGGTLTIQLYLSMSKAQYLSLIHI